MTGHEKGTVVGRDMKVEIENALDVLDRNGCPFWLLEELREWYGGPRVTRETLENWLLAMRASSSLREVRS
jgi:hypothetical protein